MGMAGQPPVAFPSRADRRYCAGHQPRAGRREVDALCCADHRLDQAAEALPGDSLPGGSTPGQPALYGCGRAHRDIPMIWAVLRSVAVDAASGIDSVGRILHLLGQEIWELAFDT